MPVALFLKRVKNTAGKDLGEVDQLLIDRNGKVSHVVIGVGGLAGIGTLSRPVSCKPAHGSGIVREG